MSILTHVAVLSIYVLLVKANGKNPQPSVMLTDESCAHLETIYSFIFLATVGPYVDLVVQSYLLQCNQIAVGRR